MIDIICMNIKFLTNKERCTLYANYYVITVRK